MCLDDRYIIPILECPVNEEQMNRHILQHVYLKQSLNGRKHLFSYLKYDSSK